MIDHIMVYLDFCDLLLHKTMRSTVMAIYVYGFQLSEMITIRLTFLLPAQTQKLHKSRTFFSIFSFLLSLSHTHTHTHTFPLFHSLSQSLSPSFDDDELSRCANIVRVAMVTVEHGPRTRFVRKNINKSR